MPYDNLFSINPGPNRIVYLAEIPVTNYRLEDIRKLKEDVYTIMEKKLIEYDAAWRKTPNP
jgi:1-acyl-sn-glycerol-3-phosphate acyltransferase